MSYVKYVSLAELSRRFSLPRQWLKSEADAGRIPCVKVANRFKFRPDAVEEALLHCDQTPDVVEELHGAAEGGNDA